MHLPTARHEHLLREVELRGSVRAAEAAATLGVAEVTIRRDIVRLARAGRLARVHGGAVALRSAHAPQPARVLVGVVVPSATAHFPPFVRGMESLAPPACTCASCSASRTTGRRWRPPRWSGSSTSARRASSSPPPPTTGPPRSSRPWLRSVPVPVVVAERRVGGLTALSELDQVRTDHAHGAVLAVEHLAGLGHRRVGLAVDDRTPTAPHVREGFAAALARLGVAGGPDVSLPAPEGDPAGLGRALAAFLDRCRQTGTRAVLVHTDDHAARLVEAALDRGLRVPEDLAVVAYDDENAGLAVVPLTAVTPPRRELGREALRLLVARVVGEDVEEPGASGAPRYVALLPRLTVRGSCGAGTS